MAISQGLQGWLHLQKFKLYNTIYIYILNTLIIIMHFLELGNEVGEKRLQHQTVRTIYSQRRIWCRTQSKPKLR